MIRRPFLPTARQTNLLLIVGFLSVGFALYMRYLVVEPSAVGLACDAGLKTWLCWSRGIFTALFTNSAFGIAGLALASLHFIRPSVPAFALALVATGFGIVLYNVGLAALAAAILMLSFARPMRAAG